MSEHLNLDPPVRHRDITLVDRYQITRRQAQEWLRLLVAAGVAVKIGRQFFARVSDVDAWVMAGAKTPIERTRRSPSKAGAKAQPGRAVKP